MKLSHAIRSGAKLWPNHKAYNAQEKGCCAIGAGVRYALTVAERDWRIVISWLEAIELWPHLQRFRIECPQHCADGYPLPALDVASHLHNIHSWSREAIAEWVETIENALEATGDKGAEAGDAKSAPPPCSQEIKDCTPVESTLSV